MHFRPFGLISADTHLRSADDAQTIVGTKGMRVPSVTDDSLHVFNTRLMHSRSMDPVRAATATTPTGR